VAGEEGQGTVADIALRVIGPSLLGNDITISYRLPASARVHLEVFDAAGRLVASLVDGSRGPGEHRVPWDGRDLTGTRAASGVYRVRLSALGAVRAANLVVSR
jgi:flagellar hook assembly protein FlgD